MCAAMFRPHRVTGLRIACLRPLQIGAPRVLMQETPVTGAGAVRRLPYHHLYSTTLAVNTSPDRLVEPEHKYTLEELDAFALDEKVIQTLGPAQVASWLEKRSEFVVRHGRPDLLVPPEAVKRMAEHLLRLLTSPSGHKAECTPDVLSRSMFFLLGPYAAWCEEPEQVELVIGVMRAIMGHSRERGLRAFSASELGHLVMPLSFARRFDEESMLEVRAFLDEVKVECLRRGLQTFRARSLGQLLQGFWKVNEGLTEDMTQACFERVGKRGFWSRDCTPSDVSFLVMSMQRACVPLSEAAVQSLSKLCSQPSFIEQLEMRDLSYLVSGLSSHDTLPRLQALLLPLFAEMVRRLEAEGGPPLLHLSSAAMVMKAAGSLASLGPEAADVVKPLVRLLLKDVTMSSGPANYLGSALGILLNNAWNLGLPEAQQTQHVDRIVAEIFSQGFERWGTSSMSYFVRKLVQHYPTVSAAYVRSMADETLRRPDITMPMVRRVVDAVRVVKLQPGARKASLKVWAHVARLWDAIETGGHTPPSPSTLVRLLLPLGLMSAPGTVDGALMGRMCDRLLTSDIMALASDERAMLLGALSRLCDNTGGRQCLDRAARLSHALWDTQQPLDVLFDDAGHHGELSLALAGLWLDGGRPQTARVVYQIACEVGRRRAVHLLSPAAVQGLLVGLVQAHALLRHDASHAATAASERDTIRAVLVELVSTIVKLAQEGNRMVLPKGREWALPRRSFFADAMRSQAFLQDLAHLYLASDDGLPGLSLTAIRYLLEFLVRCQHTVGKLPFEMQEGIKRVLLDRDPAEMDRDGMYRLVRNLTILNELLPSEAYACQLAAICVERGLGAVNDEQLIILLEFVYKTQPEPDEGLVQSLAQAVHELRLEQAPEVSRRHRRIFYVLNELQRLSGAPITEPPSSLSHAQ